MRDNQLPESLPPRLPGQPAVPARPAPAAAAQRHAIETPAPQ
jgi:hypothetical protein